MHVGGIESRETMNYSNIDRSLSFNVDSFEESALNLLPAAIHDSKNYPQSGLHRQDTNPDDKAASASH